MNTVRACVDAQAQMRPESVFLITPESGHQLTYAGLRAQCEALESKLLGLGLKPGDKVAFLLDNGHCTAALFLATMYAGMVTVPLNAVAGVPQIEYVLNHCDARVVFASKHYQDHFADAFAKSAKDLRIIDTDEDDGPEWPANLVAAKGLSENTPPQPEQDALLLYTSGTTGLPKGALQSHRAVLAGGENTALAHELTAQDRALCVLPLYHINGEMVTVMGPLVSGGSVVMPRRFSASLMWQWVRDHACTWMSVVPTIIKYMLDRANAEGIDFTNDPRLRQLRFGRSASAPLPASVQHQFEQVFGIPMIETMGLTETCAPILSNPIPPGERKSGSPGIAYGNDVVIADESGQQLPAGEKGELLVKGRNVLSGYYKNPEATNAAFNADGWFRTGDLGYCDTDGYFFITGRLKELIIKGGENIAPREIDDALYLHEAVLEAAAIGVDDDNYGQDVHACVRLRDGFEVNEATLISFCEQQVGRFKTPTRIHFMDDLPKGPSGKIQRLKLPEILGL
jgi:acyl-CoA synthetase (AMP-forming)/AMP-acid ligase II